MKGKKRIFAAVLTAMLSAAVCLTPAAAVMAQETTAAPATSITTQLTGTDPSEEGLVITEDANPGELTGTWIVDTAALNNGIESVNLVLTDTGTGTLITTTTDGEESEVAVTYGYDGKTLVYETEDGTAVTCTMERDSDNKPTGMKAKTAEGTSVEMSKQDDSFSIGAAAIYAVIGFAIVFFVLLMLNLFIRLLAAIMKAADNSKKAPAPAPAAAPAAAPASDGKPVIPAGMKLADGSLGDIKLYNVDDATAAMIMAIVADQLEAPLNELHFKSIKEVTK